MGDMESPQQGSSSPSSTSTGLVEDIYKTPTNVNVITSKKRKRLTPDERKYREKEQAEKRQKLEEERVRKEEEKRRKEEERQEKLKAKELEKQEKERLKEQERLEKERQKEQERAKKEEERKKKEEELAKKADEKKKREEERLRKEEEKRKHQEEREKEKQREEEKKAKQAKSFTQFFVKSPATTKVKTLNVDQAGGHKKVSDSLVTDTESSDKENSNDLPPKDHMKTEIVEPTDEMGDVQIVLIKKLEVAKFSPFPFQIKSNMAVAPLIRRTPLTDSERDYLEKLLAGGIDDESVGNVGLSDLMQRTKRKELRKSGRTALDEVEDEANVKEVKIVMEDVIRPSEGYAKYRMKLLQFEENRRPAYWGTWKKKSTKVKPSNPWIKEQDIDYDFDSDDEWEDEPDDAEEIENSEGEEEVEDPAEGEPLDEDDEEGWMVPHGYLSDNEREGEQLDLNVIKSKEKEFFKSLKEKVKLGIPVIQTEKLSDFKIIFPPAISKKIRRSKRARIIPSTDIVPRGFLTMDLPSDEEDMDWDENTHIGEENLSQSLVSTCSDDGESSSDEEEFEEDDEEDLAFEAKEISSMNPKKAAKKSSTIEMPA